MWKVLYANVIAYCPPYTSDFCSFIKGTYTVLKYESEKDQHNSHNCKTTIRVYAFVMRIFVWSLGSTLQSSLLKTNEYQEHIIVSRQSRLFLGQRLKYSFACNYVLNCVSSDGMPYLFSLNYDLFNDAFRILVYVVFIVERLE
jgi:hypothetical protein